MPITERQSQLLHHHDAQEAARKKEEQYDFYRYLETMGIYSAYIMGYDQHVGSDPLMTFPIESDDYGFGIAGGQSPERAAIVKKVERQALGRVYVYSPDWILLPDFDPDLLPQRDPIRILGVELRQRKMQPDQLIDRGFIHLMCDKIVCPAILVPDLFSEPDQLIHAFLEEREFLSIKEMLRLS